MKNRYINKETGEIVIGELVNYGAREYRFTGYGGIFLTKRHFKSVWLEKNKFELRDKDGIILSASYSGLDNSFFIVYPRCSHCDNIKTRSFTKDKLYELLNKRQIFYK